MLKRIEKIVNTLTWRTAQAAQLAMVLIMLIIVANIVLRQFWRPLGGTVELVEMAGAVLLALGVAYTALKKGHIMVGILVERLPARLQGTVEFIVSLLALFFCALLAREISFYAWNMMQRGYETGHLRMPLAPSIFIVAFGFFMLGLVLFLDLCKAAVKISRGSDNL